MAEAEKPTPLTGEAADVAQASHLCIDCGLCCTGVVHDAGVLDADEVAAAGELGLAPLTHYPRDGWLFPCAALEGTLCGIFGRRPRCCSRYQCQVLVEYLDGRQTLEEAAAHTRHAGQLFNDFMAVRPGFLTIHMSKLMARDQSWTPALREVIEKATVLQRYVDRHFRKPGEVKLLPSADQEE